jgi:phosphopantothenoylcysteine decarboxylase/phosphopantothenate--cysteine ligase
MSKAVNESKSPVWRIALGVTGGIAAYKAAEILRGLQRACCEVRVCMTRHACEFVQPLTFRSLSGSYVVVDDYAPENPDPIAHITFSQTIDLLLVAPATANTIAKFANGIADDFLTSTYLACTAPVIVAPAMNTVMWRHPATQRNVEKLRADGVHVVEPDDGEMACGTIGPGRLSEPDKIVAAALEVLREGRRGQRSEVRGQTVDFPEKDLGSERILITTGATREHLDPVRFISNRSSGRMGFALAEAARDRGAHVTLIAGATTIAPPSGVRIVKAITAEEMRNAVVKEIASATVFIAAAAVSDYRPVEVAESKIKKSQPQLKVTLERTVDILREVAQSRSDGQIIVGFAAETNNVLAYARQKLIDKNLDIVVANDVSRDDGGFDSENNAVSILLRDTPGPEPILEPVEVPLTTKLEAAHRILEQIAKVRRQMTTKAATANS